ncbi:neutral/alkaline non-lysosomal ceramidase N-terminal domain-containing protein [Echinicola jeungdonensis]|uniref:Neutral/alkaline non-lysosomal ceramidase N-terminal domain-containing protein n=1 Tax=Echinicola jeungdonensis TaxID=709343 RepID=A0ABV5J4M1_9BACT|nr:neutral/alkaline non-lysosomal ceramidase N-terminal domain-containing protein [Echinicola jeungdonensis]MDN3668741.1 neutral/alkaline non-lysosomal ceramidase N-terminal domain-containing protein [Echinicola jeungdonensis]
MKILAWSTGLLLLLALVLLKQVDWSPLEEQGYYQETMEAIDQLKWEQWENGYWMAGWSSVNVTPSDPVDLVGYKPRGEYEFVQDSSFVKVLVLGNGQQNIAFLNYELLIVHPFLAKSIQSEIKAHSPEIDHAYFTATHTHSGMGGYIPGLMGKIAFGGFDEEIVDMLAKKTIYGIQKALNSQDTVKISYKRTPAADFVANRFIASDPVDPFFRQLIFAKRTGERATFLTYAAHATCLSSKFMGLSGDYPFYLTHYLEEEFDFAIFAAGAVGSHKPVPHGNDPKAIKTYARELDLILDDSIPKAKQVVPDNFSWGHFPLSLPEAHYRISDNIRLRPWVFNGLFGDTNAHIDLVRIGNTLLLASSGEISGVFYEKWEKMAKAKGLNLIITTFNGGYMGYITPDKYYNRHYHEVRDMNWYGPHSGSYFDAIISQIIQKIPNS